MKFSVLVTCALFIGLCSCSKTDDQEVEQLRSEVEALQTQLDEIQDTAPQADLTSQESVESTPPSILAPKNSLLEDYENSTREREMRELQADVERMKWQKVQSDAQESFEEIEQEKCARNIRLGLDC